MVNSIRCGLCIRGIQASIASCVEKLRGTSDRFAGHAAVRACVRLMYDDVPQSESRCLARPDLVEKWFEHATRSTVSLIRCL